MYLGTGHPQDPLLVLIGSAERRGFWPLSAHHLSAAGGPLLPVHLLEDAVVDQQLGGERSQQRDANAQAEAAAGAVEGPPQADGERRQRQRQLRVVGKVHFLNGESRCCRAGARPLTPPRSRKEGYSAGVVDAHEDGDAAHHAGPLPLKAVRSAQAPVDAGVQEPDDGYGGQARSDRQVTCGGEWTLVEARRPLGQPGSAPAG